MTTSLKALLDAANAVVPRISGAEAVAMAKDPNVLIVDVRDAAEVKVSGKAKGAAAVSRGLLEFRADPEAATHDAAFDPNKTIIVHCAAGARAALAGKTLRDLGYTDVRNLGRFQDWLDAGGEVEPG
ncbi:MAG: rhodanese-like domain-containing protein [Roseococcus sp.]